ncbi:hypothetical protein B566_EDAN018628 [Ephemera danica]|nr:hypothetical protein B566_EDAN018628 [Ephemera danica]
MRFSSEKNTTSTLNSSILPEHNEMGHVNNFKSYDVMVQPRYRMPAPEGCPPDMYELMLRCWEYQPERRYRMPAPEGCPPDMYELMLRCWEYQPERRPHFDEIYKTMNRLCDSTV